MTRSATNLLQRSIISFGLDISGTFLIHLTQYLVRTILQIKAYDCTRDLYPICLEASEVLIMAPPPGLFQFLRGQLLQTPSLPTTDLTGQTIIVTGANTGLGLECAKHLVRLNVSTLILACRSVDKGEAAKQLLLSNSRSQTAKATVEVWPIDMSSYASVLSFGDRCQNSLHRLDAVVENAGISQPTYILAEDNESTITVNVISTFLLALLLLPKICKSAARYSKLGHLTVVGSAVHFWADTKDLEVRPGEQILERLNNREIANMKDRYNMSKLLGMLCVRELAAQVMASPNAGGEGLMNDLVVINNVAPGWCQTELFRNEKWGAGQNLALRMVGRSSEHGARTLVHGATEAGRESHGEYLSECQVKKASPFVTSKKGKEAQDKVWREVVTILEKIRPGISKIV
jgi:retinol dehydrogenase 12